MISHVTERNVNYVCIVVNLQNKVCYAMRKLGYGKRS